MSLIHNERVELTATYLNGLAIAIFAVGGLAPLVAIVSGTVQTGAVQVAVLATVCVGASMSLHLLARHSLSRLSQ